MLRCKRLLLLSLIIATQGVVMGARPENTKLHSKLDWALRMTLQRLETGASVEQLRAGGAPATPKGELDVFIVGPASSRQLQAAGARVRTALPGVATAFVPIKALSSLESLPGVRRIEAAVPVQPTLDVSVPTTDADKQRGSAPDFPGINGAGVLVGSVDQGVDYNHQDFRNPDGTSRFVGLWDQTNSSGPPPAGYAYGTECTSASLDAQTCAETDTVGHGTHVLGIAAGDGSGSAGSPQYIGVAPKADLIHVKVDFSSNTRIVDGVAYIMNKAASLGKNAVVNLSLGTHRGPHDGSSAFEACLNALTGSGRIIVDAAGNDALMQIHTASLPGDEGVRLSFGGTFTQEVTFNGYYDAPADIDVVVTTPGGLSVGPVHLGQSNGPFPGLGTPDGHVYIENGVNLTANNAREVIIHLLQEGPTYHPVEDWRFRFEPVDLGGASGRVDVWRFHTLGEPVANFCGSPEGPCFPPTAERLIIEPANAGEVITVGAWNSKSSWVACDGGTYSFTGDGSVGAITSFSSPGPTRDGRLKPDIAAPGSAIASTMTSDPAPPTCPGPFTPPILLPDGLAHRMNHGTSMAAPHVTGAAALLLQRFGAVSPTYIKNYLNTKAVVDGSTGAVPNTRWGYGKLRVGDLANPTVQVLAPNGGETLFVGTSTTLRWNATDLHPEIYGGVTSVDLLLSRTGIAGSYSSLFMGIANSGSKTWTVSGAASTNAFLKVVAHDAAGNTGQDISDAAFTIKKCGLCQVSYCGDEGFRCTYNNTCGAGNCCSYSCAPDPTCSAPDPCPPNACSCSGGN